MHNMFINSILKIILLNFIFLMNEYPLIRSEILVKIS